ncbi:MAG: hypothetical protein WCU88_12850 [Elusimicrobiota bacterium]|jgi:hypothetical protein
MKLFKQISSIFITASLLHSSVGPAWAAELRRPVSVLPSLQKQAHCAPGALPTASSTLKTTAQNPCAVHNANVVRTVTLPAKAKALPALKKTALGLQNAGDDAAPVLNLRYDNAASLSAEQTPVLASASAPLAQKAPVKAALKKGGPLPKLRPIWSDLPLPAAMQSAFGEGGSPSTVYWIAGVVAAAVLSGLGYAYVKGSAKQEQWEKSKSNQDVLAVESARRSEDTATLQQIAIESRARQSRMRERIAAAKSSGTKKVEDATQDPLKVAEAYLAFDGLAAARAELNLNAVSKDPVKRIGMAPPESWKQRLSIEEAAAKNSGSEGILALQLKGLSSELKVQDSAVARLQKDFASFDEAVPSVFKGRLAEMSEHGKKDLAAFKDSEVESERGLHAQTNAAMRGRVSESLTQKNTEYRNHRSRMERLAATAAGTLKAAVELAQTADQRMADMASHESSRLIYLGLAAANESVPVTVDDSYTDDDGNYHSASHTVYEDHSGPYKMMAASEASAAHSAASEARANMEALSKILPLVNNDPVLIQEQLADTLPAADHMSQKPSAHGGIFFDFFLPASWSFFGGLFSAGDASKARANFSPILNSLQSVFKAVQSRRDSENSWMDKRIDRDLNEQMSSVIEQR